eukprot:CAMPEP_0204320652 /NCGR_PEP_ID=MMETSP0469-20131031/7753_1 /ASSEMBLY_ACC=CAM_ASM_000384 /TAXON_ID=2969 /ORGANISM="Oxyrrhis marina" /LENGTH=232 /DNA_ID=CAMNT_0051301917 /DNA_START=22 /DNA_END=720 /DNA_ORIENTATION=-
MAQQMDDSKRRRTDGEEGEPLIQAVSMPGMGSRKVLFRPQIFWQEVEAFHIVPLGLELKFNMETGKNYCRLPGGPETAAAGNIANSLVEKGHSEANDAAVAAVLRGTVARNDDGDAMRKLLWSCHITHALAASALVEAAKQGRTNILQVLLKAGAPVDAVESGRTPLLHACACGHEEAALAVVNAAASVEVTQTRCERTEMTPLELARDMDFCGMARRLKARIGERWPETVA